MLYHTSGTSYGPIHRKMMVAATGPQAFGSSQSYIEKYFLRALFKVPTGETDADADEQFREEFVRHDRATRAKPAIQEANPNRALATEAHRRIAQAIDRAPHLDQLNKIRSGDKWGPLFKGDLDVIEAVAPDSTALLVERYEKKRRELETTHEALVQTDQDTLLAAGYDAAEKGTQRLNDWWITLKGTGHQAKLKGVMDKHLKPLAATADSGGGSSPTTPRTPQSDPSPETFP